MILVRNCPHNNGIYTIIDNAKGMVLKSSYLADGIMRLTREYAGYHWYLRRKGSFDNTPLHIVTREDYLYCRLYIKHFSGRSGEYYKNLTHNQRDLIRAISIYSKIWPRMKGQLVPLHGDFSLGNLIICGEELNIIDWEHFRPDAAPWGFDLVNLLYESAFFSFRGKNTLSKSDRRVFIETRNTICALLNPGEDFICTIENLTKFICENSFIWGDLVNKLPVTKFSAAQKQFLRILECSDAL